VIVMVGSPVTQADLLYMDVLDRSSPDQRIGVNVDGSVLVHG